MYRIVSPTNGMILGGRLRIRIRGRQEEEGIRRDKDRWAGVGECVVEELCKLTPPFIHTLSFLDRFHYIFHRGHMPRRMQRFQCRRRRRSKSRSRRGGRRRAGAGGPPEILRARESLSVPCDDCSLEALVPAMWPHAAVGSMQVYISSARCGHLARAASMNGI